LEIKGLIQVFLKRIIDESWCHHSSLSDCRKDAKLLWQFMKLISSAKMSSYPAGMQNELCSQIEARMRHSKSPRIMQLVQSAREYVQQHGGYLFNAVTLTLPGGQQDMVLKGHTRTVEAICLLSSNRIASGGLDDT
jgi:hypothetical protein